MRLPSLYSVAIPLDPGRMKARLEQRLSAGVEGYLRAQRGDECWFMFLHRGTSHCVGRVIADHPLPSTPQEFVRGCMDADELELCVTDLPLLLCAAVMFRKPPSDRIPIKLLQAERLLKSISSSQLDAVLSIRSRDARNLVFCRNGNFAALYPARDEVFPQAGGMMDRVLEYAWREASSHHVQLDLYEGLALPAAPDCGLAVLDHFEQLDEGDEPDEEQRWLVVSLDETPVFHYPLLRDVVRIGRGQENDLALDDQSVGQEHAYVLRSDGELLIESASETPLNVDGQSLERAPLKTGSTVQLGIYKLGVTETRPVKRVGEDRPSLDPAVAADLFDGLAEL